MKKGVVLTIALSILLIPALLSAQGPRAPKMMCKQDTEISDEQQAKLAESLMEFRLAGIELGAQLEILQIKMNQEFMKDDPSKKVLMDLAAQISATKEKLHKQHIDHMLVMKSILGPDGWKKGMSCCGGMDAGRCMGMDRCGGGGCCQGACHGCACTSGCASGPGRRMMIEKECSHMCGGNGMGGAWWPSGSCCQGGMKNTQGCTKGQLEEKVIERRCVEKSSGT